MEATIRLDLYLVGPAAVLALALPFAAVGLMRRGNAPWHAALDPPLTTLYRPSDAVPRANRRSANGSRSGPWVPPHHPEYLVPAEELPELNRGIVGPIEVVRSFTG